MIKVEGFQAFHGAMKIIPKIEGFKPFQISADWLYDPSRDCWYGNGSSYPAEVCEVLREANYDSGFRDGYKAGLRDGRGNNEI